MKNIFLCLGFALFLSSAAFAQIPENSAPATDAFVSLIDGNDFVTTQLYVNDPSFNPALKINAYEKPTALEYALYKERSTIAVAMLKSPNFAKAQWTDRQRANVLLKAAAKKGNLEALKMLSVKSGFGLNLKPDGYNLTVLHEAVSMGNLPAVQWLLKQKINVGAKTSDGRTALHYVNDARSGSIAALLVADKRVDLNAVDKKGNTALHEAADSGDANVLKPILNAPRTNPNLKNKLGQTPLFVAASCDIDLVNALLSSKKVKVGPKEKAQIKKLKAAGGYKGGMPNAG